jgi:hypothetical protein
MGRFPIYLSSEFLLTPSLIHEFCPARKSFGPLSLWLKKLREAATRELPRLPGRRGPLSEHGMLDEDLGTDKNQTHAAECFGDAAELFTEDAA